VSSLRVAMLLQSYRPVLGGAQRQVEQLAPLLAARGIEVHVITRRVPGTPSHEHAPGASIDRVSLPGFRVGDSVAYTAGAARRARTLRPDVVHAFDLHSPSLAAMLSGPVPLVAKILSTGPGGDVDRLRHKALGAWRLRLIARRFAAFQTLSEEVERELAEAGVPRERMVRIVNGVDTEHFRPATAEERAAARARLGVPAEGRLTLYCGRFAPVKRLDVVIDAFREAPGHLLLLGEGPEEEALRARAAGLAVTFHAPLADPADAYRAADVYVSASTTEGMSGSMLEAMASGLAVVARPASGVADLLGGGAGVIADDLGRALREAQPAELGARARTRAVESYALRRTADLLADLYRGLAA
jgi:glycosyltransferase involved in cell wall biosynthesis